MADVTIKALKNRPYEVAGGGASKTKPFCDGSREDIGFKAEETAARETSSQESITSVLDHSNGERGKFEAE